METQRTCRRSLRWIREQWRGHVAAQASSGLSGVAYCRRHGLRAKSFYRWRRVFGGAGMPGGPDDEAAQPLFAEVRVGEAERGAEEEPARVEVVARGGRAIRVWPGFDAATLTRALVVVEELHAPETCRYGGGA